MQFLKKLFRKDDRIGSIQILCNKERYGSEYGGWTICPEGITRDSIVYSFGIGDDISFDIELIERFGITVHAFDPAPESIQWLKAQKLPENFKVFEFGIACYDGMAFFYPHKKPAHISSYSIVSRSPSPQEPIKRQVYCLKTIMDTLGHKHIDILKIDVEGFEYDVIRDIVSSEIQIGQLLIEFHRFKQLVSSRSKTKKAIELLNKRGFKIFEISKSGSGKEYSFIYIGH